MHKVTETIKCSGRSDRVEIFPFYDCHIGKRNCAEDEIRKQVKEILRRSKLPNRHVRVVLGGDMMNAINPPDVRRFDFAELADWLIVPTEAELEEKGAKGAADIVRAKLSNISNQELKRAVAIFSPIKHLIVGAITGNHERMMKTRQNVDVHGALCDRLNIVNMTDEGVVRLYMKRSKTAVATTIIYLRHGYGAGRTPGAEPNRLARLRDEWEDADICFSGHSHDFCIMAPKAVATIPRRGKMPDNLHYRYRFAANCGCWLYSHLEGPASYESAGCYPAKPMMTLKAVIWPFWSLMMNGELVEMPKVELRQYAIL